MTETIKSENCETVSYVMIAEEDSLTNAAEFQLESDGSLLLSTLQVQYPTATSLKYRNPEMGTYRTLKVVVDRIFAPSDNQGWHDRLFVIVQPKGLVFPAPQPPAAAAPPPSNESVNANGKRPAKLDEPSISVASPPAAKISKSEGVPDDAAPKTDLVLLNLKYEVEASEIQEFFGQFGEIQLIDIKKDPAGTSRGFAFLRYKDKMVQRKVLLGSPYEFAGRSVNIRRSDIKKRDPDASRLFVTKMTEDIQTQDLETYFEKFGKIIDIYIPRKPFRGFGFLTFATADSLNEVLDDGEEHVLGNGMRVVASRAAPRGSGVGVKQKPLHTNPAPRSYHTSMSGMGGGGGGSLMQQPPPPAMPPYNNPPSYQSTDQEQLIYQAVKHVLQQQQQQQQQNQGMRPNPNAGYGAYQNRRNM